ncbi:hypothetical protein B0H67DRAFT_210989 [Lasiosphaeris hirsuta]|uniref:Uncharacterized protein n=1 Tax=Lasiosphaeris hirsuta TaxID=260670 RepID=A0AA40AS46_9PEZI|nr:hypothetical protein B0H67DRAFT_210989 [Lasiosphaeris hirsuta]
MASDRLSQRPATTAPGIPPVPHQGGHRSTPNRCPRAMPTVTPVRARPMSSPTLGPLGFAVSPSSPGGPSEESWGEAAAVRPRLSGTEGRVELGAGRGMGDGVIPYRMGLGVWGLGRERRNKNGLRSIAAYGYTSLDVVLCFKSLTLGSWGLRFRGWPYKESVWIFLGVL